jgi:hypothetical protein
LDTTGTIRPSIQILTRDVEKHPKAREIYEAGKLLRKSFDKIGAEITATVPALQNPLPPIIGLRYAPHVLISDKLKS